MIIQSSKVAMAGASSYERTETVRTVTLADRNGLTAAAMTEEEETVRQDSLELLSEEMEKTEQSTTKSSALLSATNRTARQKIIQAALVQLLSKNKMFSHSRWNQQVCDRLKKLESGASGYGFASFGGNVTRLVNRQERTVSVENSMHFQAAAQVKTADGREINVDVQLNMSQSFYSEYKSELSVAFCDPLVINLNAPSAQLSQTKFEFDLDCDGEADQISRLLSGSGYLALDKNEDGEINDGSELFGAKTGDGFSELGQYDQDGNGWIDEADDIFHKLRIWQHNEDGTTTLTALGEAGVGAIYLGSTNTDYLLGDIENPDGMIRKTGFFLFEDGQSGTMQHVDLAV